MQLEAIFAITGPTLGAFQDRLVTNPSALFPLIDLTNVHSHEDPLAKVVMGACAGISDETFDAMTRANVIDLVAFLLAWHCRQPVDEFVTQVAGDLSDDAPVGKLVELLFCSIPYGRPLDLVAGMLMFHVEDLIANPSRTVLEVLEMPL